MNALLIRALAALVPVCLLLSGSLVTFLREKTVSCTLQVLGAGSLMIVILTHIFEALRLAPWMGWGLENSPGHYLDLSGAILAVTFFPIGYLIHCLKAPSFADKKRAC